jgi:hypothetical protein
MGRTTLFTPVDINLQQVVDFLNFYACKTHLKRALLHVVQYQEDRNQFQLRYSERQDTTVDLHWTNTCKKFSENTVLYMSDNPNVRGGLI